MKSEAQKERGLTSRFHSFDPGSMRRSSKSHPRTEFTRTPSSLSMSRSQSSGRDPRMLDMMKARSVGSESDVATLKLDGPKSGKFGCEHCGKISN